MIALARAALRAVRTGKRQQRTIPLTVSVAELLRERELAAYQHLLAAYGLEEPNPVAVVEAAEYDELARLMQERPKPGRAGE